LDINFSQTQNNCPDILSELGELGEMDETFLGRGII
jgi:hypothetical protein